VKPRLAPGDENSFFAQLSTDARDSRTLFLAAAHSDVKHSDVKHSRSETRGNNLTYLQQHWKSSSEQFDEVNIQVTPVGQIFSPTANLKNGSSK